MMIIMQWLRNTVKSVTFKIMQIIKKCIKCTVVKKCDDNHAVVEK